MPAFRVEDLEQLERRVLDALVAPLGGPVQAGDDPGPVDPRKSPNTNA
jgi:hypothetical protein